MCVTVEGFIATVKTATKLHTLQTAVRLYSEDGSVRVSSRLQY
jgi:hypothetical protein